MPDRRISASTITAIIFLVSMIAVVIGAHVAATIIQGRGVL